MKSEYDIGGQKQKGDVFEYVLFYRVDLKPHTYFTQL